jgi:hypothetical protein
VLSVELGLDPKDLTDEQWAQKYAEWFYVQRIKLDAQEKIIEKVVRTALADTLKAINGK